MTEGECRWRLLQHEPSRQRNQFWGLMDCLPEQTKQRPKGERGASFKGSKPVPLPIAAVSFVRGTAALPKIQARLSIGRSARSFHGGSARQVQAQPTVPISQDHETIGLGPGADAIETWTVGPQQLVFAELRGFVRSTELPIDPPHGVDEPDRLARSENRVPVGIQALPKIFRLAHVNKPVPFVAHQVNAGLSGQTAEEPGAESFEQRSRGREEAELSLARRCDLRWFDHKAGSSGMLAVAGLFPSRLCHRHFLAQQFDSLLQSSGRPRRRRSTCADHPRGHEILSPVRGHLGRLGRSSLGRVG